MNYDIDNMIAHEIVLIKIVIEGKADVGNWALLIKTCFSNFLKCKSGYSDVGVLLNCFIVIKKKRSFQGIGIY
jgi:hypothetical protein